ncbi:MAG: hypothetical protein JOY61_00985, partial [Chloroflexi bacterium]|nr:hypothetical protein [Chloroflexota bacterium]
MALRCGVGVAVAVGGVGVAVGGVGVATGGVAVASGDVAVAVGGAGATFAAGASAGAAAVCGAPVPIVTVSNVTVLSAPVLCDVTARPASTVPVIEMVTLEPAIGAHVTPSVDVYAVNVVPERATWTYAGTPPLIVAALAAAAPAVA